MIATFDAIDNATPATVYAVLGVLLVAWAVTERLVVRWRR